MAVKAETTSTIHSVSSWYDFKDAVKEEKLKAFSWLPREKCPQEVIGTIYKIPTFYTIFYERRIFDYKSCYIGNIGSSSIIRLDENGEQVLFV